MGGGPVSVAQPTPGLHGQGPSGASYGTNPPGMNGAQPPPTNSGAIPGMPAANPTLLNPTLQHLQSQSRIPPGYPAQGQGMQMQTVYAQRAPGAPMGAMGPMGQMGQGQQRMPNGVVYTQNPDYRPQQPGQQSPQQEMQTAGASGSPKQSGSLSKVENSSPHLQGANGNIYDVSRLFQRCVESDSFYSGFGGQSTGNSAKSTQSWAEATFTSRGMSTKFHPSHILTKKIG